MSDADAFFPGKFMSARAVVGVLFSNVAHILPRQFRVRMRISSGNPVTLYGIAAVIGGRARDQVSGIDAARVIARVPDQQPIGYRAMSKDVRDAVRAHVTVFPVHDAVAEIACRALPEPARIRASRAISTRPEARLVRWQVRSLTHAAMPLYEALGLALHYVSTRVSPASESRRLTAAAFAKVGSVVRGWYSIHASASNQVLVTPGLLTQRRDFLCLHYSMNGGQS